MFIDTHCHLNSPLFAGRVGEVVARAEQAGVRGIVVPGWDEESSRNALALAARYPLLRPAVGLHPWFVTGEDDLGWLEALLDDPRVAAVGEIGMDRAAETAPAHQEAAFRAQLALAGQHSLPVLLHCRRGWDVLLAALQKTPVPGVAHAFSGSLDTLHACLKLGLYISFAGMVTRRNSRRAQLAAAAVPLDRLLLETDAPYMALEGIPAEESEPALLPRICAFIADLRALPAEELARQSTANAEQLLFRDRKAHQRSPF